MKTIALVVLLFLVLVAACSINVSVAPQPEHPVALCDTDMDCYIYCLRTSAPHPTDPSYACDGTHNGVEGVERYGIDAEVAR